MTQLNHDGLRVSIRALIDTKETSQAAIARETGASQTAISQFINGKYKGDNNEVATKLAKWLDARTSAQNEVPNMPSFIETPTVKKIWSALGYAQITHTITVIYGHAGVGKTKAIKEYAATGNNVWCITASKTRSNVLETLYELALEMGGDAPYQRGALSRHLRRRLSGTNGMIIVDEADHLDYDAIEELRLLQEECNVSLALVGNHKVYDRMSGNNTRAVEFARLFSRIAKKIVIDKALKSDVDAICDGWSLTGKAERSLIQSIASRPGALRSISLILPLATIYAQGKNEPVNEQHIQSAMIELGHNQELLIG